MTMGLAAGRPDHVPLAPARWDSMGLQCTGDGTRRWGSGRPDQVQRTIRVIIVGLYIVQQTVRVTVRVIQDIIMHRAIIARGPSSSGKL